MTNSIRTQRINELILRELTLIFRDKSKDPRFKTVRLSHVDTSKDLSTCKVFFFSEQDDIDGLVKLLNRKQSFFRYQLSQLLALRHTPQLKFIYDATPKTSQKIDELLSKI